MDVVGLMNVQYAIQDEQIYILEVNPRASRTVPFVSKAIGVPLAKVAARCMAGRGLNEQGIGGERVPSYFSVKEAVFPFAKFPGVDLLLGPEMKSTGEVMGVGRTFGEAFIKAQQASGNDIPRSGTAFVSVRDADKSAVLEISRNLVRQGFDIVATRGTADFLGGHGVDCRAVNKVAEGRPHVVDMIKNDEIHLIVNTTEGKQAIADSYSIRREALMHKISYFTTIAGARVTGLSLDHGGEGDVYRLQDLHEELSA
jgi:carbamoyl-phosphate synthase large subunit